MTTPIDYKHIISDPEVYGGRPIVAGHRIAVIDVALWTRQGMTPEQITREFPLTLAEVHAALTYYYDHQAELDSQLERDEARLADYAQTATTPIMEALRRKAASMREDASMHPME